MDVRAPSARVYEDALDLAKILEEGRMSALRVFGGIFAGVMVVVEDSVSVTCSCEDSGPKMGVTRSRIGGEDKERSRTGTATGGMVSELLA
jgi:hypothetical protein